MLLKLSLWYCVCCNHVYISGLVHTVIQVLFLNGHTLIWPNQFLKEFCPYYQQSAVYFHWWEWKIVFKHSTKHARPVCVKNTSETSEEYSVFSLFGMDFKPLMLLPSRHRGLWLLLKWSSNGKLSCKLVPANGIYPPLLLFFRHMVITQSNNGRVWIEKFCHFEHPHGCTWAWVFANPYLWVYSLHVDKRPKLLGKCSLCKICVLV